VGFCIGRNKIRSDTECTRGDEVEFHDVEELIAGWVNDSLGDTIELSYAAPTVRTEEARVSAYLLDLSELPPAQTRSTGPLSLRLKLRYLMTTWAQSESEQNRMLSELMFSASTHPNLSVDITPLPLALWTSFGITPRPGVIVEVVLHRSLPARDAKRVATPIVKLTSPAWLNGKVVGPRDVPIPGALVELPECQSACRTDAHGRFTLACAKRPKNKRLCVKAKGVAFNTTADQLGTQADPVVIRIQFQGGVT
jgi:hypothetical protein